MGMPGAPEPDMDQADGAPDEEGTDAGQIHDVGVL